MDWKKSKEWIENANKGKQPDFQEPNWSFDCGLKLDFDGGLIRVCSRFYQEKNDIYDGSVSFYIGDEQLFRREFSCRHIDVLKDSVEGYVENVVKNITLMLTDDKNVFVKEQP